MKSNWMDRVVCWWLAGVVAWLCGLPAVGAAVGMEAGFRSPPASARPHTWWHWMNGNVTREGITADLESMARVGVGGAQIFNVGDRGSVNIPDGPAPFMSPAWLELMAHAGREADRVGVELCLHNCAGWSSSGGPWIPPEHAMQILTVSETNVQGPGRFAGRLPMPPSRLNYYQDVAVVAFPTPADDAYRLADYRAKAGYESRYGLEPELAAVPEAAVIPRARILDLTDRLAADGSLAWEAPSGDWTVLRIGHTPTGKTNHPAPESGLGLECDKLSRAALDVHWDGGIQPILDAMGPTVGRSLNNVLIDSYEVGCNNWTPGFREAFRDRRGYDLWAYLPALAGRVVESGEVTERFLWDFRRTIADLFAENYFGYFAEKCRAHGLLTSVEPYDGPFECLAVGAEADILMGEFWVGSRGHHSCRLAATVAHTHGRRIVGAESFTAAPDRAGWRNHPRSLKALGDLIWSQGVNRFIFHRYAQQPWMDKFPGMTMGQWGSHFDRTSTWWEPGKAWMTYLARAQYLLQEGQFVADVLFFGGAGAPAGGIERPELKQAGFDYDVVGTDLVPALRVRDGRVTLPSGMSYRLLVLPDTAFMTPELAETVRELVRAGATVLGPKPDRSPSLAGHPDSDARLRAIADEVWGDGAAGEHRFGAGRVFCGQSPAATLVAMGVARDMEVLTPGVDVPFIHRRGDTADWYFVSNQREAQVSMDLAFRIAGRPPQLWHPLTGEIEPAPLWRIEDGRTMVSLTLDPAGSVVVVFPADAETDGDHAVALEHDGSQPPPAVPARNDQLEIRRAEYGVLSRALPGSVDVTDVLVRRIRDGRLEATASNDLAGDPAQNIVKSLRVDYRVGDDEHSVAVRENQRLSLPRPGESGKLEVVAAVYGDLPEGLARLPEPVIVDITERVAAVVEDGALRVRADNTLAGGDPAYLVPKQLRVAYVLNGNPGTVTVAENSLLRIPAVTWRPTPYTPSLHITDGAPRLLAWCESNVAVRYASDETHRIAVPALPAPLSLDTEWTVRFPPGWGAPEQIALARLLSWPEHPDPGIRYFSGTGTYQKSVSVPASWLGADRRVWLDLGRVEVMAEVFVNGEDLGVLWCEPYRLDITDAVREGENALELRVTNLWPNRLIGDAQFPDDVEWNGNALQQWPDWMRNNQPRPVPQRFTFTTWKHWDRDDELLPSGLIGPVRLLPAAWQPAGNKRSTPARIAKH